MLKILVVEDNDTMRLGIIESLKRENYKVFSFSNGSDALDFLKSNYVDLAILDLKMEPISGMELLAIIKKDYNKIDVLIISAYGNVQTAVDAIKNGAADFLTKPFSPDELRIRVKKISNEKLKEEKIRNLIAENEYLQNEISNLQNELIGNSESFTNILKLVDQVAAKESPILLSGESGTGKELIAKLIHNKSLRADKSFIKVNCAALNENLLESELFGHEKGAFTGAVKSKKGRFELANNGTLFLDEIGEISPAMQVKLLRVIQEGEFEKVGGEITLKTNVRIISATNKNLHLEMSENRFREDLFYRLNVIPIHLPSLQERKDDIKILTEYFLKKSAVKNHQEIKTISENGYDILKNYSFPGNIRELENLIERLSVVSDGETIDDKLISYHLNPKIQTVYNFSHLSLDDSLFNFEKNMIIQALKEAKNVKHHTAKILKINTSTLYYKLEKFGLL
ncbi:MAG: sigma-54-dependent Fis family transcriptional regulator [Ignavibacteriae bacterium]|nr:sigma-54-dependent Fis family transcriptional regulator [Ignavibacteriota bacterium]